MKTSTNSLRNVAILLVAVGMFACNKKSEQIKYIPKDANIVLVFDVKSIGAKSMDFKKLLSIENVKNTFRNIHEKDSTLEKIKNSGIDLMSTAYFFSQINEEAKGYGALSVALTDAAKFESFVSGLDKNYAISSDGEFKFASKDDMKSTLGWNSSTAILLVESTGSLSPKETLLSFFQLKKEESLAETNTTFKELQKESGDISLWIDLDKFGNLASQYSPTASAFSFKETFVTAVCNFEKGKIVLDSKYHANKETAEKLSFTKGNLGKGIVNALPGKSVVAMMGISLDMNKIYNYLEKEKLIASVDQGALMTGLSSKEILEMFSGEFAGTLNGAKEQKGSDPKPEFSLVIGINDTNKSSKLLAQLTELGLLTKGEYYSFSQELFKDVFIVDKGSYIIVAGPESMRQLAVDGNSEKINSDLRDLLTENPGVFYLNFSKVPDNLLAMMGSKSKAYIKNSQLESITVTGSAIRDNVSKGKVVFAFKQKEENSLITLSKASQNFSIEEEDISVMPDMEESGSEEFGGAYSEENILEEEMH